MQLCRSCAATAHMAFAGKQGSPGGGAGAGGARAESCQKTSRRVPLWLRQPRLSLCAGAGARANEYRRHALAGTHAAGQASAESGGRLGVCRRLVGGSCTAVGSVRALLRHRRGTPPHAREYRYANRSSSAACSARARASKPAFGPRPSPRSKGFERAGGVGERATGEVASHTTMTRVGGGGGGRWLGLPNSRLWLAADAVMTAGRWGLTFCAHSPTQQVASNRVRGVATQMD